MIVSPLNRTFLLLMLALLTAVWLLWFALRRASERVRAAVLLAICACNIAGFFVYKSFLSVDAEFLRLSGLERFNWLSELPVQLCNINMFLIPLGILTKRRSILGFSFFLAPLGAAMALFFPELPFSGFSLALPRILGFYLTHMTLILCGLSLATLDFYRPERRDFPGILAAFLVLAAGAHVLNTLLRPTLCPEANYFFTYGADISILNFLWNLIPIPFFYELPALLLLLGYMGLVDLCFHTAGRVRAAASAR